MSKNITSKGMCSIIYYYYFHIHIVLTYTFDDRHQVPENMQEKFVVFLSITKSAEHSPVLSFIAL